MNSPKFNSVEEYLASLDPKSAFSGRLKKPPQLFGGGGGGRGKGKGRGRKIENLISFTRPPPDQTPPGNPATQTKKKTKNPPPPHRGGCPWFI